MSSTQTPDHQPSRFATSGLESDEDLVLRWGHLGKVTECVPPGAILRLTAAVDWDTASGEESVALQCFDLLKNNIPSTDQGSAPWYVISGPEGRLNPQDYIPVEVRGTSTPDQTRQWPGALMLGKHVLCARLPYTDIPEGVGSEEDPSALPSLRTEEGFFIGPLVRVECFYPEPLTASGAAGN